MPDEEVRIEAIIDPKGAVAGANATEKQLKDLGDSAALSGRQFYYAGMFISQFSRILEGAGLVMMGVVGMSIKAFADFQQQMVNTASVSNATAEEMNRLGQVALDMSTKTRFSATEVAKAMYFLGSAGYEAKDILSSIAAVADLAGASLADLDTTSSYVATTLAAFSMEASESRRVVDVFQAAIQNSQLTLQRLGVAMSYIGPIASDLGLSLEETTALLAALNDVGIQGSKAGTSLRAAFAKLVDITPAAEMTLYRYGLTLNDVNPNVVGMAKVLENLKKANIDVSDTFSLFGLRGAPAMAALMRLGEEGFGTYIKKVTESNAAAVTSTKQLDTLSGNFIKLKDTIISAGIMIGKQTEGPLTAMVKKIQELTERLVKASPEFQRFVAYSTALGGGAAYVAGKFGGLLGMVVSAQIGLMQLTGIFSLANKALPTTGALILRLTGLYTLGKVAIWAYTAALNPMVAVIIGLAGILPSVIDYFKKWNRGLQESAKLADEENKAWSNAESFLVRMNRERDKWMDRIKTGIPLTGEEAAEVDKLLKKIGVLNKERLESGKLTVEQAQQMMMAYGPLFEATARFAVTVRELSAEEEAANQKRIAGLAAVQARLAEYDAWRNQMTMAQLQEDAAAIQAQLSMSSLSASQRILYEKLYYENRSKYGKMIQDEEQLALKKKLATSWFVANSLSSIFQSAAKITGSAFLESIANIIGGFMTLIESAQVAAKAIALAMQTWDPLAILRAVAAIASSIAVGMQLYKALATIRKGQERIEAISAPTVPEIPEAEMARIQAKVPQAQEGGYVRRGGLVNVHPFERIVPAGEGGGAVTLNLSINIAGGMFDNPEYWRKITKDGILPALREIGLAESSPNVYKYE